MTLFMCEAAEIENAVMERAARSRDVMNEHVGKTCSEIFGFDGTLQGFREVSATRRDHLSTFFTKKHISIIFTVCI